MATVTVSVRDLAILSETLAGLHKTDDRDGQYFTQWLLTALESFFFADVPVDSLERPGIYKIAPCGMISELNRWGREYVLQFYHWASSIFRCALRPQKPVRSQLGTGTQDASVWNPHLVFHAASELSPLGFFKCCTSKKTTKTIRGDGETRTPVHLVFRTVLSSRRDTRLLQMLLLRPKKP